MPQGSLDMEPMKNMKIMNFMNFLIFEALWLSAHGFEAPERRASAQCSKIDVTCRGGPL